MTHDAAVETPLTSSGSATMTGQIASSELRAGDLLGGRFRIESLLGVGGMGVVYRARDLSLDIDVALKLLRPELARRPGALDRFRSELLLSRQVSSPHVVRIHDIAEHDGRWFISMDFIDGESLEAYRDRVGKIPTEGALAITRGLLEGLAAAHQRGVIHRDLKPANVLLDKNGHPYITDFGVARSLGATGMTQSGIIVGTPEYLSPEQARGDAADARSDLYTAGLILYEMLTGSLPFAGGTPAETVIQRIVRPPPSLAKARPDLPHWLHAFTDRLLRVQPAHRFANARDALRALDTKRVPRPPLNRRAIFFAVLALVAATGLGAYFWRHPLPLREIVAPMAKATPRVAVLPFSAPEGDDVLVSLARAFEAHAHEWLRGDPELGVIPRTRTLDALARAAPGVSGAALDRQLANVAAAANATRVLRGRLARTSNGIALDLTWVLPGGTEPPYRIAVQGKDPASLFAAYESALAPALRKEDVHLGTAPPLPASALQPFGHGLLALDRLEDEKAASELAPIADTAPASALVNLALLDAEEGAHQDLSAENTRDAILKRFQGDASPAALGVRARAESGEASLADLARAVSAFPHDPDLAMQYAKALEANGDGEKAIAVLTDLVRIDDQDAQAWFALGRSAINQGHVREAVDDYLVRALVLDIRSGDIDAEAATRNAQGYGYERLGQIDAAIEQYSRAAALREKSGDKRGLAQALSNLAMAEVVKGDRDSATANLAKVKDLLDGLGDRASLAKLYNNRGVVAEEQGDYVEAISFYREALTIRQQLNEPTALAESLNNIGFASYELGRFDDASVFLQQALTLYTKLDDRNRQIGISLDLGLLDVARGHFPAARQRMESSLTTAEDNQLVEETAVAHANLGELALIEGSYTDAENHIARAAEAFRRRSDRRGEIESNLIEARIALATGDLDGCKKALAAIPTDAKAGNEQSVMRLLLSARLADLRGDRPAAAASLDEAAQQAATAHLGTLAFRIRIERAREALAAGETKQAGEILRALRAETTVLGQVPLYLELLELEIASALREHRAADAANRYREALPLLRDAGRYAYATTLHALGAHATPAGSADASAAASAAASARASLLAAARPATRAALEAQLDRRLRQDIGDAE
ncbi:MAG TPA: tetratricopeptide repeat protein [Rhodanobacteraceae bacterium]|nr:tetratricopeptide repeat protein [Rhodanobacteraceae bacterium]